MNKIILRRQLSLLPLHQKISNITIGRKVPIVIPNIIYLKNLDFKNLNLLGTLTKVIQ